eukprot:1168612-Rhodomonas_salina.1
MGRASPCLTTLQHEASPVRRCALLPPPPPLPPPLLRPPSHSLPAPRTPTLSTRPRAPAVPRPPFCMLPSTPLDHNANTSRNAETPAGG